MTTAFVEDASASEQPGRGAPARTDAAAAAHAARRDRAEPAAIAELTSLTPGATAILETFAPSVRARALALGLHPGQVVRCVAVGSAGIHVQARADEDLTVLGEIAQGILVRPVDAPHTRAGDRAALEREVRIPRGDEDAR